MNSLILLPLVCMFFISAHSGDVSDVHTGCYNYFLNKDTCVWASVDHPCDSNDLSGKPSSQLYAFDHPSIVKAGLDLEGDTDNSEAEDLIALARRYDTTTPTLAVGGGTGICGFYNSTITSGVCLWSGEGWVDGDNKPLSGWLNGDNIDNCNKKVYIQRQGLPETVQYAPVLDGCGFNTQIPATGCFQIWLSIDLFKKFNPTPEELAAYKMDAKFTWDFDNEGGNNPESAPV